MKWTAEQEEAIYSSGQDILVSAAAGSGKTAVLVERIIQKLLDEREAIDIDSLLVVTFTNAAAKEMRSRIGLALEKALQGQPESQHLKRQLSLLQRASISTLHAFCMEVVREHAYLLEIDPAFRIANELEADLLKQEVIDDLFEKKYGLEDERAQEAFFAVVDRFSSDRSDAGIEQLILQLYTFAKQHPWPYEWLDQLVESYRIADTVEEDDISWLKILKNHVDMVFQAMEKEMGLVKELCSDSDGPYHYLDLILEEEALLDKARSCESWDELQELMTNTRFKRLPSKRVECNKDKQTLARDLRTGYRDRWNDLKNTLFTRPLKSHLEDMRQIAPIIETLTSLVKEFDQGYTAIKRENSLVDFLDLEHFTLQILLDESSEVDKIVPSAVALQYKANFKEVLVDEYQDTNLVQETILNLLTDQIGPGNTFMVGDVKQSIYRFRHAEPSLFIQKYNDFKQEDHPAKRIELARNFRSREPVLTATNFIFRQILDEEVGEINYDEAVELVYANKMYEDLPLVEGAPEVIMIDKDPDQLEADSDLDLADLQTAQIEARAYARKIKQWLGKETGSRLQVVDQETDKQRPIQYRDIVILLRSMNWAPVIVDEFKKQGIPVYADLKTGYFSAIEIKIMLSYLKIIDNPHQDIPLVAVLRSPIVGLTEDELAKVRLAKREGSYYDALQAYVAEESSDTVQLLEQFLAELEDFRFQARQGALSELIWNIFRETGYYDFVGGMPGGRQRQANLRALYDRAKNYERTSFRGLFRFLRFIEWMEEKGEDLGAARALSEQEDVVRITTIHSSKGLEFPAVIVGGLARRFNLMDLNKKHLLHKDLGFASKFIDPIKRITYPTLFYHAVKNKLLQEQLAEEMRVLYVALTRAKEKLVLFATVNELERELKAWQEVIPEQGWVLPEALRMEARTYLDWLGPSLVRHRHGEGLRLEGEQPLAERIYQDPSIWEIESLHAQDLVDDDMAEEEEPGYDIEEAIHAWQPLELEAEDLAEKVEERLSYQYAYPSSVLSRAKQSVTELKRQQEIVDEYSDKQMIKSFQTRAYERPQFMKQTKKLSPAEIGTAMHTVMQHLPFTHPLTADEIEDQLDQLIVREILTEDLKKVIDLAAIEKFFKTPLAEYMMEEARLEREVPFSLSVPAREVYPHWPEKEEESVLIQGIIDCLIPYEDGWLILDYKTDAIYEAVDEQLEKKLIDRYRVQMKLYKRAIETILGQPVKGIYLYFFSQALTIKFPINEE